MLHRESPKWLIPLYTVKGSEEKVMQLPKPLSLSLSMLLPFSYFFPARFISLNLSRANCGQLRCAIRACLCEHPQQPPASGLSLSYPAQRRRHAQTQQLWWCARHRGAAQSAVSAASSCRSSDQWVSEWRAPENSGFKGTRLTTDSRQGDRQAVRLSDFKAK